MRFLVSSFPQTVTGANAKNRRELYGVATVIVFVVLALGFGAQRGRRTLAVVRRAEEASVLVGTLASFMLHPTSGRLEVTTRDGRSRLDVEMSLVVDGVERPLVTRKSDVRAKDKATLVGDFPVELGSDASGSEERANAVLELRMDPASDLLTARLAIAHEAGSRKHTYALRFGLSPENRVAFVPGRGAAGPGAPVEARSIVLDDDRHPFAFFSGQGPLTIAEIEPDTDAPGAQPRLVVSAVTASAPARGKGEAAARPTKLDLALVVGASSQAVWGRLGKLLRLPLGSVKGVVTGTTERAYVLGLDDDGHPFVRAVVDEQGRFSIEAPTQATQWVAALEANHASAPIRFVPGTPSSPGTPAELRLDVSSGGELDVKITNFDTGEPLVARLIVKGLEGTLDPTFGPDYRASGAGPLMDILEGEVTTPLPAGKYRVLATKGIEWSIDSKVIEVVSGHTKTLTLALRRVVPTPGMIGCDLHVHARPSFDTPVTAEDRVLSLVSAGVDFAVPTEHNMVGDYGPPLEALRLSKQLAHVPGVEVTTYNPRYGHFGVFPYSPSATVPPYKGTTVASVVAASRRGDPNRFIQINHPRLLQNIGYFNILNFDPKSGRFPPIPAFDAIEVYNGYELSRRELTERVMNDWFALLNAGRRIAATGSSDSHRIQYQWAGYPRTYALLDPRAAGDTGLTIDTKEVVAALKRGRSFVTSGPVVEFELSQGGRAVHAGEGIAEGGSVSGTLRVRAAPWLDVSSVELLAGVPSSSESSTTSSSGAPGTVVSVYKASVPSRALELESEPGTLEEAYARSVRFETELQLTLPRGVAWVVATVRGDRAMDDALPFMPIQPLAFTNPIYVGKGK